MTVSGSVHSAGCMGGCPDHPGPDTHTEEDEHGEVLVCVRGGWPCKEMYRGTIPK